MSYKHIGIYFAFFLFAYLNISKQVRPKTQRHWTRAYNKIIYYTICYLLFYKEKQGCIFAY